jgi:AMP-polyphosphate phosphotransferase
MLDKIDLTKSLDKKNYKQVMPQLSSQLFAVQKATWDAGIPVVILFEGWDAAGKGTSIRKITTSLDPRGYKLYPIRPARTYEKKHPWLWRFWLKIPARGEWAIFDRSWYGRVMVERVEKLIPESEWRRAYREISEFERTIADDGTVIFKFFLHISKKEQKRRFENITKDLLTAWQVTSEDWDHHRRYNDWLLAYEEAFERTDSEYGPWTIVEATDRHYTWVKIYTTIINTLRERLELPIEPLSANIEEAPVEDVEDLSGDMEFGLAANFEDELDQAASLAEQVAANQPGQDVWTLEETAQDAPANPGKASPDENTTQEAS